jgi:hypothetical protein
MAFNITPPSNIAHLFGNWLNGISKKRKPTLELGFVPFYGLYGMFETILSLTNQLFHHFCRLSL